MTPKPRPAVRSRATKWDRKLSERRTEGARPYRHRALIVCEGATECEYLEGFRRNGRLAKSTLRVIDGGEDPKQLVERAVQLARESDYDSVWCAFDTEAPDPHASLQHALDIARSSDIPIARSNPCFELWLLLHLRSHTGYLSTDEAIRILVAELPGYHKEIDEYTFRKLEPGVAAACQRARDLEERHDADSTRCPHDNPFSTMYRLIEHLLDPGAAARPRRSKPTARNRKQ